MAWSARSEYRPGEGPSLMVISDSTNGTLSSNRSKVSVGHVTLCFWRFVTHSDKSQTLSGKSGS